MKPKNIISTKLYTQFDISPERLISDLKRQYNFTKVHTFVPLETGFVNLLLVFSADSSSTKKVIRFFGKFSEFTPTELAIQMSAHELGLTTATVLKNNDGQLISLFGDHHYAVFDFVDGKPLDFHLETIKQVGQFVAKIQTTFYKIPIHVSRENWITVKYRQLPIFCQKVEENLEQLSVVLPQIDMEVVMPSLRLAKTLEYSPPTVPIQLVHCDIYTSNLLRLKDNGQLAVFDFEAVAMGHPMIDLMTYVAWDLLSEDESENNKEILDKISTYLQAYRQNQKVLDPEFCYQLISVINLAASISQMSKAITLGFTAFDRYHRYYRNCIFAQNHKTEILELLHEAS